MSIVRRLGATALLSLSVLSAWALPSSIPDTGTGAGSVSYPWVITPIREGSSISAGVLTQWYEFELAGDSGAIATESGFWFEAPRHDNFLLELSDTTLFGRMNWDSSLDHAILHRAFWNEDLSLSTGYRARFFWSGEKSLGLTGIDTKSSAPLPLYLSFKAPGSAIAPHATMRWTSTSKLAAVPEPDAALLTLVALAGLGWQLKKRRRQA